jgi:hypothetical protein
MAGLMLKREENGVMMLIERSVETPRSPSMAARNLAGPTSGRPYRRADLEEALNNNAQYPRIPSKVLKGALHEEVVDDVVAELAMLGGWSTMKPKI